MKLQQKYISTGLLLLCLIFFALTCAQRLDSVTVETAPTTIDEEYRPDYHHISSVGQAIKHIDSIAARNKAKLSDRAYINLVDKFIRQRFYHGYSFYRFTDNYISYLGGCSLFPILYPVKHVRHRWITVVR